LELVQHHQHPGVDLTGGFVGKVEKSLQDRGGFVGWARPETDAASCHRETDRCKTVEATAEHAAERRSWQSLVGIVEPAGDVVDRQDAFEIHSDDSKVTGGSGIGGQPSDQARLA
jgi:hypothetical protein